ncbi:pyrroline-5-carboxylate reductase [Jeotgalibacillus aurantiacus]|uniref:pyrroline-5-carboxylate reductase n=1 Tax=Jeotgalibacillus aurantiacus TaxID=2763266 RepID=UPI001D0B3D2B|nr:pyrroline-5-carboxylate reductase [Jeotgalibacillus aurantiacus]
MKLIFVGAGSMAEAMIKGMKGSPSLKETDLWITNRSDESRLDLLCENYGIKASYDLQTLLAGADVIVLAVKPKDAAEAIEAIKPFYHKEQLLISVLAGLSIEYISRQLGESSIARAMPNTSATIQQSATGLSFNDHVTDKQKITALSLFSAIGSVTLVEEARLDLVTGLSGSGPAYIYYVVEAMEQAAVELGLSQAEAKPFIIQTLKGAAQMLESTNLPAEDLRKAITSEGGTTEAGIAQLDLHQVKAAFKDCIKEATLHSGRLRERFEQTR